MFLANIFVASNFRKTRQLFFSFLNKKKNVLRVYSRHTFNIFPQFLKSYYYFIINDNVYFISNVVF